MRGYSGNKARYELRQLQYLVSVNIITTERLPLPRSGPRPAAVDYHADQSEYGGICGDGGIWATLLRMATLTFDTLKFANKLKAAGLPPDQAEAQACVLHPAVREYLG